jgi:plastocyanin
MKRALVLLAITAVSATSLGCEGEPPIMAPENPSGTASAPASAATTSGSVQAATEPPPALSTAMTACPPPPCAPVASAGVATSASGSPTAPETTASATPLVVPPPTIPRGNIVGVVTTKPTNVAAQAVVFLEDGPKEDVPAHLQTVTIANRQMNFIPFVAVAAVGGKVQFTNEDPFPHNVFSPDNEKFNMGNIPQNGAHVRVFKSPGAYSLLCNLHPGMLGYLVVTPSTWFARTDSKGKFEMKHVPSGTYKVTAWGPRQAPSTQSVTVSDGDVAVNFDLHR